ncbi:MAG: bifunctional 2-keto-4-hydroxyglutarate aldolase/2-keto-3-deoxy-6-phosphogluconate aldolase [Bacilli bacterium]
MQKYEVLKTVNEEKIVAIVRVKNSDTAIPLVDSLVKGGIKCIEVTFTSPYMHSVLETISRKYDGNPNVILGAGSILDPVSARVAILSGAKFIVTPTISEEVVKICNLYSVPVFSGVMSPTEALKAKEVGVDVVKIYPADQFKFNIIKSLKGPMPTLEVMPTGGVNITNIKDWIKNGAFACGVGGSLFDGLKEGNFEKITNNAKEFLSAIKEAKENE